MSAAPTPRAWTAQTTVATPLGDLLLARTALGLGGAWFESQQHHPGPIDAPVAPHDALLARAAQQLRAYFAGQRTHFELALDLQGTPFQQQVWRALQTIAHGHTSGYAELAQALGRASAVRAVGGAVGRNPVSVIVPCHRVIGHDGSLTGYAGGLQRKRALLALECARPALAAARAPSGFPEAALRLP